MLLVVCLIFEVPFTRILDFLTSEVFIPTSQFVLKSAVIGFFSPFVFWTCTWLIVILEKRMPDLCLLAGLQTIYIVIRRPTHSENNPHLRMTRDECIRHDSFQDILHKSQHSVHMMFTKLEWAHNKGSRCIPCSVLGTPGTMTHPLGNQDKTACILWLRLSYWSSKVFVLFYNSKLKHRANNHLQY